MNVNSDEDILKAKKQIALIKLNIKKFEDSKTSKTLYMKMSITGILHRFYSKDGGFNRLSELRSHYGMVLQEFDKNFELAKKCWDEGDMESLDQFFNIYV